MLDFARAYKYVFSSQKWLANLAIGALCHIIPIVGQIVFIGYGYELIETWHRKREDQAYPDFELTGDAISRYLVRGCWPFLVSFLIGLVNMPVILGFQIFMMTNVMPRPGKQPDWNLMVTAYAIFIPTMMVLSLLVQIISVPMQLRSGLAQNFKAAWSLEFVGDFFRRVGGALIVMTIIQFIVIMLLAFGGLLLFCVGAYFTLAWGILAQFHLYHQLYEKYLERGGQPIPLKDPPPTQEQPPIAYA